MTVDVGPVALAPRERALLGVLALSSFVVVIDYASVVIPLPSIAEDLGGTIDLVTWVVAAFILALAVALPVAATLARRFGARPAFLAGGAIFTAASVACALAADIGFLIGARVVLGVGAALIEVGAFAAIGRAFSGARRERAMQIHGIGFLVAGGLAPILSGAITTLLGWPFIFWLDALVGLVALVGAWRLLPSTDREARPLDLWGTVLAAAGLFGLGYGIIGGARIGWGAAAAIIGLCVLLLAAFTVVELRTAHPLLDIRLLRNRRYGVAIGLRGVVEFTSLGVFFALSHFLQVEIGYSALGTGALLMAVIVGAVLVSPIVERVAARADVRWLTVPGFLLVAVGVFWAARVNPDTDWLILLPPLVIFGAGIGALESPIDAARQHTVGEEHAADAWRLSYVTYLLGIGAGVAVVSAVWQTTLAGKPLTGDAFADAVNAALLVCALAALVGAAAAVLLAGRQAGQPQ